MVLIFRNTTDRSFIFLRHCVLVLNDWVLFLVFTLQVLVLVWVLKPWVLVLVFKKQVLITSLIYSSVIKMFV